ncbi:MAG: PA14 domain-containing protein [Pyrinomonadaceae bacterium]
MPSYPTDNLKNADRASMTLAVPYGRHVGEGHLVMSVNAGSADPNHQIKFRQALCEGPIEGVESVYYQGTKLDASAYTLYDGTQLTAPGAPFDLDSPHHLTAMLDVTLPVGMADADVKDNPPSELAVIGKFLKVKNYDASGTASAAEYSVNPARVIADLIHERGGEPLERTNWPVWTKFRNYFNSQEDRDYTTLDGFDGIGLTGYYYSDLTFTTLHSVRIDPSIHVESSSGSPAAGLPADNFSVRWKGKIKAKATGTTTFNANFNDTFKLYVGDLSTPVIDGTSAGSATGTKEMTDDQLYDIVIEWTDASGAAECRLTWTPPGESVQTIAQEFLYPFPERRPIYEAHTLFESATSLDAAVRQVLLTSNSVMQLADGKRQFFSVEQLTPVMDIDESLMKDGTFKFYRRSRRDLRNHWEAFFRDLDSQYIEVAQPPVTVEFPELQNAVGRVNNGQAIDLDNSTHWQAYKVLKYLAKREVEMDVFCEFDGTALTYKVLPGDLVRISNTEAGFVDKQFIVLETIDYSSETTADRRGFVCLEWTDPEHQINYALASIGATASGSSSDPLYPAAAAINGIPHTNNQWGDAAAYETGNGWKSVGTPTAGSPEWLEVDFGLVREISQVDVITQKDDYTSTTAPERDATTFTLYGITDYKIQYWNGSSWTDVVSVTGNNKVWRRHTFVPVSTQKVRVLVTGSATVNAQIIELEAWG